MNRHFLGQDLTFKVNILVGNVGRKKFIIALAHHLVYTKACLRVVDPRIAQVEIDSHNRNGRAIKKYTQTLFIQAQGYFSLFSFGYVYTTAGIADKGATGI